METLGGVLSIRMFLSLGVTFFCCQNCITLVPGTHKRISRVDVALFPLSCFSSLMVVFVVDWSFVGCWVDLVRLRKS